MKVLLANDDGVFAPGIKALYNGLKDIVDIVVVAPDSQRSASGHGITLTEPLRFVGEDLYCDGAETYAVNGTPVDCVKLAVNTLLETKPDLLISGINLGENTGCNLIYSGTVAAAIEGAILGIPSVALSLTTYTDPTFVYSVELAKKIVSYLKDNPIEKLLLNINIPSLPEDEVGDIVLTSQGNARFFEKFQERKDPGGRDYYWLSGEKIDISNSITVDEGAILNKMVSVTPLRYDMTDYSFLDKDKSEEVISSREELNSFIKFLR